MKKEDRLLVILNSGVTFYIHKNAVAHIVKDGQNVTGAKPWQYSTDNPEGDFHSLLQLSQVAAIIKEENKR